MFNFQPVKSRDLVNFFPQTFPTNVETLKETCQVRNQSSFSNASLLTNFLIFPNTISIFLPETGGIKIKVT